MRDVESLVNFVHDKASTQTFSELYGFQEAILEVQRSRYDRLLQQFRIQFPQIHNADIFVAPGRTEVGGNHTDHNAGRVLAAAVDLDIVAVVAPNDDKTIQVYSDGFAPFEVTLNQLSALESEKFSSAALVRGVAARAKELGFHIGGFNTCLSGTVPKGSGLSSSAAFEVLMCKIISDLYNDAGIDAITNARISQFAENVFFGKPCGLMDQTTCALGGLVFIDFIDFEKPIVKKVQYDFYAGGYMLVIVNTGGSHADLTNDYTAIENEMRDVARFFGPNVLRAVPREQVVAAIPELRKVVNDRAILRALHFYADDQRVVQQVATLQNDNLMEFLSLITESGNSSWMLCQNCYPPHNVEEQGIPLALEMSKQILDGRGAYRVHGGGFAGTIQAFVPLDNVAEYKDKMQAVFGPDSCHEIIIRQNGVGRIAS